MTRWLPVWLRTALAASGDRAFSEFLRMMAWIALAGVIMVALALGYLSLFGPLHLHMVVATILGVFFSVLIGSGLFAAAFFSDKSGHDERVDNATRSARARMPNPVDLPPGLAPYRRSATFTEATVPAALLRDHDSKEGSWGLIHVEDGALRYRIPAPRRAAFETILSPDPAPGLIEPTIRHNVEPLGPVRFHIEFWRAS